MKKLFLLACAAVCGGWAGVADYTGPYLEVVGPGPYDGA